MARIETIFHISEQRESGSYELQRRKLKEKKNEVAIMTHGAQRRVPFEWCAGWVRFFVRCWIWIKIKIKILLGVEGVGVATSSHSRSSFPFDQRPQEALWVPLC